jgi:mRNA interferase MazF
MPDFPRQGSIYWFDPEPVKGSEIRKIRPCVVVSPDEMNENLRTVIVVPLTSTIQPWPFRLTVSVLGQKSSVACDQLRSVDKSRLKARIGSLKTTDREALFNLLQSIFSE